MKTTNSYTSVWKYCSVYTILSCLSKNRLSCMSKNRLYIKMLRINLFSIFTIKMPQALAALAP